MVGCSGDGLAGGVIRQGGGANGRSHHHVFFLLFTKIKNKKINNAFVNKKSF